ncbi:MAG TPA: hypothetical protein VFC72_03800 [Corynebacterium sp.]|nr:hypothetical protein [Corynebacterium sp.]
MSKSKQKITAAALALSLAGAAALSTPHALAEPMSPPPNADPGTCQVSLSTTVPEIDGDHREVEIAGVMGIGLQNFGNLTWRPWIQMYPEAERMVTGTTLTLSQDNAPEGDYSVSAMNWDELTPDQQYPGRFAVWLTRVIDPDQDTFSYPGSESLEIQVGDLNAGDKEPSYQYDGDPQDAWAKAEDNQDVSGAMWVISGSGDKPNPGEPTSGTLRADTTYLPLPGENDNCVPITVHEEEGGYVLRNADAADRDRISGTVYQAGTDTEIEGAQVSIGDDGTVTLTLPEGVKRQDVAVQLFAGERKGTATDAFESYLGAKPLGERLTFTAEAGSGSGSGSSGSSSLGLGSISDLFGGLLTKGLSS